MPVAHKSIIVTGAGSGIGEGTVTAGDQGGIRLAEAL